MFIYIYHAFIISYILASFAKPLRPLLFLLVNFIFILSAFAMAYLLEKIEENKLVEFVPKSIKKVLGIR
jgi:peptidoglycan/LPS O-acetylase OafA/YrhL